MTPTVGAPTPSAAGGADSLRQPAPGLDAAGRPDLPVWLSHRLAELGAVPGALVQQSPKSLVLHTQWDSRPVIVKAVTSDDPQWVDRHTFERGLYARLTQHRPPMRIATLLHAEDRLMILERLDGDMLHPDRYPPGLQRQPVVRALQALDRLHAWRPPAGTLGAAQPITAAYVQGKARAGHLTTADLAAIDLLLAADTAPTGPEHADPWPSNFLLTDTDVAVVDLEHLGMHVPGLDWAIITLLWAPANPWIGDLTAARVAAPGMRVPYALNLILIACREWAIHLDDPTFAQRRPTLLDNIARGRALLHATADTLTGRPR